jgi:cell wall-associated NlpC family hydrolase
VTVVAVQLTDVLAERGSGERVTQALLGEPVLVLEEHGEWLRVVLPWQPGPDPRGYPGWVRREHLCPADAPADPPADERAPVDVLEVARRLLGAPYLWGGLGPAGIDCSGLVHWAHRRLGRTVPRDAADQHARAEPVPVAEVRVGDLYFFAREDGRVFHVGLASGTGEALPMLHAGQEAGVEERPMAPHRREALFGAGRVVAAP